VNFHPCTEEGICKIVRNIKSNTAQIDGMSTLKMVLAYWLPVILYQVNISIQKGVFTDALKITKVIPLHKGGTKVTYVVGDQCQFCQFIPKVMKKLFTTTFIKIRRE